MILSVQRWIFLNNKTPFYTYRHSIVVNIRQTRSLQYSNITNGTGRQATYHFLLVLTILYSVGLHECLRGPSVLIPELKLYGRQCMLFASGVNIS